MNDMPLDPQAELVRVAAELAAVEGRLTVDQLSPADGRKLYAAMQENLKPAAPPVSLAADITMNGPAGQMAARYYRPFGAEEDKPLPMLVYFHGGGWVIGDLNTHDVVCRCMANAGGFAVVSVDYRLAPESPFPAAVEDAFAATAWAASGAGGLAVDRKRIAIGGDSAGGALSAAAALWARDEGIKLAAQVLIYPATDMRRGSGSQREYRSGYLLTEASQDWFHHHYFIDPDHKSDWRASPQLAGDHGGLAPAYVLTASHDPLRDEGEAYARVLEGAGNHVTYRLFEGQMHGFITMGKVITAAGEALNEIAGFLAARFKET